VTDDHDDPVAKLIGEHPCTTANQVALAMVEQLDTALHGTTWARPETPMAVWHGLLEEVRQRCRATT